MRSSNHFTQLLASPQRPFRTPRAVCKGELMTSNSSLSDIAPAFVDMAHQIVWCSVATVDPHGRPRSRVLHPLWEWDGEQLVGWVATGPTPIKRRHLEQSPNVSCNYCGPIPYEQVHETFAKYHAFLFPTLNENFGHVILEAFLARIPAILSDQTFWRDLEQRDAGVDLPLEDDAGFRDAIRRFVEMDQETFSRLSDGALQMAHDYLNDPEPVDTNRALFLKCIERG